MRNTFIEHDHPGKLPASVDYTQNKRYNNGAKLLVSSGLNNLLLGTYGRLGSRLGSLHWLSMPKSFLCFPIVRLRCRSQPGKYDKCSNDTLLASYWVTSLLVAGQLDFIPSFSCAFLSSCSRTISDQNRILPVFHSLWALCTYPSISSPGYKFWR